MLYVLKSLTLFALDEGVALVSRRTRALRSPSNNFALCVGTTNSSLQARVTTSAVRAAVLAGLTVLVCRTQSFLTTATRLSLIPLRAQTYWPVLGDTTQGVGATRTFGAARILAAARVTGLVDRTVAGNTTPTQTSTVFTNEPL